MVVTGTRARLWPFVLLAFLGVLALSLGAAAAGADEDEPPAVELLK